MNEQPVDAADIVFPPMVLKYASMLVDIRADEMECASCGRSLKFQIGCRVINLSGPTLVCLDCLPLIKW